MIHILDSDFVRYLQLILITYFRLKFVLFGGKCLAY